MQSQKSTKIQVRPLFPQEKSTSDRLRRAKYTWQDKFSMILTSSRRVTAEIRTPVNYDLVTRCSTDGAEDNSLTS